MNITKSSFKIISGNLTLVGITRVKLPILDLPFDFQQVESCK